jgi:hypothetical protein
MVIAEAVAVASARIGVARCRGCNRPWRCRSWRREAGLATGRSPAWSSMQGGCSEASGGVARMGRSSQWWSMAPQRKTRRWGLPVERREHGRGQRRRHGGRRRVGEAWCPDVVALMVARRGRCCSVHGGDSLGLPWHEQAMA